MDKKAVSLRDHASHQPGQTDKLEGSSPTRRLVRKRGKRMGRGTCSLGKVTDLRQIIQAKLVNETTDEVLSVRETEEAYECQILPFFRKTGPWRPTPPDPPCPPPPQRPIFTDAA